MSEGLVGEGAGVEGGEGGGLGCLVLAGGGGERGVEGQERAYNLYPDEAECEPNCPACSAWVMYSLFELPWPIAEESVNT